MRVPYSFSKIFFQCMFACVLLANVGHRTSAGRWSVAFPFSQRKLSAMLH